MKRRDAIVLLSVGAAAAACHRKPKVRPPPPPPPRVTLLTAAPLRATAEESAAVTETLPRGTVVAVEKTTDKWGKVTTDDGKQGFVPRSSFARRTIVVGTERFPYTYVVGDRMRKLPMLDVVRVEQVLRMMPGSPAGGVEGADQLDGGARAALVIAVTGAGRQFLFEVVDRENRTVIINSSTRDTTYMKRAVDELTDTIMHALEAPAPGASASPTASATPTPRPESPHPNAPLPLATPQGSATPSPSATP